MTEYEKKLREEIKHWLITNKAVDDAINHLVDLIKREIEEAVNEVMWDSEEENEYIAANHIYMNKAEVLKKRGIKKRGE